jgi:hypothetical protein
MFHHDAPGTSNHFEIAPLRDKYTMFISFRQFQFDFGCTDEQILKAGAFSCILPAFQLKLCHPLAR